MNSETLRAYSAFDRGRLCLRKRYTDVSICHRIETSDEAESFLHGHNIAIEIELSAPVLDAQGSIYDFTRLSFIETWIAEAINAHTFLAIGDTLISSLQQHDTFSVKLKILDSVTIESICEYIFKNVLLLFESAVEIVSVKIEENSQNSIIFRKEV